MYTEERADLVAGSPEMSEMAILDHFERLAFIADDRHIARRRNTLAHAYEAFEASRIPKYYSDLCNIDNDHDLGVS